MAKKSTLEDSAKGTAIITGSFLSGTMTSLSLMAIPVFLDTTHQYPQLYQQWTRMYHYGHQVLPAMAVATMVLYGYVGLRLQATKRSWARFALAGIVTVIMVPFTWVFMEPTNSTLFRLEAETRDSGVSSLSEAQELVKTWAGLHLMRSMFPLAGAVIGLLATIGSRS